MSSNNHSPSALAEATCSLASVTVVLANNTPAAVHKPTWEPGNPNPSAPASHKPSWLMVIGLITRNDHPKVSPLGPQVPQGTGVPPVLRSSTRVALAGCEARPATSSKGASNRVNRFMRISGQGQ